MSGTILRVVATICNTVKRGLYNAEMNESRQTGNAPLMAVVVCLALLGPYLAGYFLLGKIGTAGPTVLRVYRTSGEHWLFMPAAKVESLLTGRDVQTAYES
jgi:hypothetical protein